MSFFPRGVLDEILNLIESVSEDIFLLFHREKERETDRERETETETERSSPLKSSHKQRD